MKQLLKISKSILALSVLAAFMLAGCRSGVKNGKKDADTLVTGANAAVYTKASAATTDSGTYKVVVHDDNGNLISGSTVVTVA